SYFHDTLNLVLARFFGVERPRLVEQHGSRVDRRRRLRISPARSSNVKSAIAETAVVTRSDAGSLSGSDPTVGARSNSAVLARACRSESTRAVRQACGNQVIAFDLDSRVQLHGLDHRKNRRTD